MSRWVSGLSGTRGGPPKSAWNGSLVIARLLVGAAVAALAAVASLVALWARTGVDDPVRVVAGTAMTAAVYLGLGAVAGATVTSSVNGTVLLLFVWILDVFFGPALSASDSAVLRLLLTHYVSLWTMELPTGHSTPAWLGALPGSSRISESSAVG